MPFPPLELPSVSQSIVTHLEDLILDGVLVSGAKLPSERKLAEALKVSRNSLREALARLHARGIIEFEGRTARVTSIFDIMISSQREELFAADADDLVAFWQLLNGFTARLAASRATGIDVGEIRRLIEVFEARLDSGEAKPAAAALGALARQVGAASYNFVFQQVLANYLSGFEPLFQQAVRGLEKRADQRAHTLASLLALAQAIAEGDPLAAEQAAADTWGALDLAPLADPAALFSRTPQGTQTTSAQQAARKLTGHLKALHLAPGSSLPPGEELASALSLSVNAVSLASSRLEALGVLKAGEQGGYVFVKEEPSLLSRPLVDMMQKRERAKQAVYEFRLMLEEEAAAMAAIHRSPNHLAALKGGLEQMEIALSSTASAYSEADMAFHREIAAAGGNEALDGTLALLNRFFAAFTKDWLTEHQDVTGNLRPIQAQHVAIFEAIETGEAAAARAAMGAHLGYVISMTRSFTDQEAYQGIARRRLLLD